jgi:hypothetical protein
MPISGDGKNREQLVEPRAGGYGNAKQPIMQYATVRTFFMNLNLRACFSFPIF